MRAEYSLQRDEYVEYCDFLYLIGRGKALIISTGIYFCLMVATLRLWGLTMDCLITGEPVLLGRSEIYTQVAMSVVLALVAMLLCRPLQRRRARREYWPEGQDLLAGLYSVAIAEQGIESTYDTNNEQACRTYRYAAVCGVYKAPHLYCIMLTGKREIVIPQRAFGGEQEAFEQKVQEWTGRNIKYKKAKK